MTQAIHCFFEVHMGASHKALGDTLTHLAKRDLKTGECAVFINRAWTACKILYHDGTLIYHRNPNGSALSLDAIKFLPTKIQTKLTLPQKAEASVLKAFEAQFKTTQKRLNVAYA